MAAESSSKTSRKVGETPQIAPSPSTNPAKLANDRQPIRSEDLLQGCREVQILHAGDLYRLTLTRSGKLILHK